MPKENDKNREIYYACERTRQFMFMRAAFGKTTSQRIVDLTRKDGSLINSLIAKNDWETLFKNQDWLGLLEGAQNLSMMENDRLKSQLETIMQYFPEETAGYLISATFI